MHYYIEITSCERKGITWAQMAFSLLAISVWVREGGREGGEERYSNSIKIERLSYYLCIINELDMLIREFAIVLLKFCKAVQI